MAALKTATRISVIRVSAAGSDADTVRDLFLEYGESLGFNTCFGGLDQELATLPGDYAPPRGCLLLAKEGGDAAGCIAVRPLDESGCEMRRLFVRPRYRCTGLGRRLAEMAINGARAMGYRHMFLETLPTMLKARALYASLGFKTCAPYLDNACIGSDCFQLDLGSARNRTLTQTRKRSLGKGLPRSDNQKLIRN